MKTTFMKMTSDEWPVTGGTNLAASAKLSRRPSPVTRHPSAFTLVELLVVISIMGILAGFTIPVLTAAKRQQYLKTAQGELKQIEGALENYKARYGSYPPSNPLMPPELNTLYYELSGTTHDVNAATYTTLDGSCTISEGNYDKAFKAGGSSIGGIINCTKGGGEDAALAKNFLPGLKQNRFGTCLSPLIGGVMITNLITSVKGPDTTYRPVNVPDVNPFRYSYPGTNNVNSFDLWIDLSIRGKTNRICNWKQQPQILP